jgi:hypothetical protein
MSETHLICNELNKMIAKLLNRTMGINFIQLGSIEKVKDALERLTCEYNKSKMKLH